MIATQKLTKEYFSKEYQNQFDKMHDDFVQQIKSPKRRQKEYSIFYPQVGLEYNPNYTDILVVGRAINGKWSLPFICDNNNGKAVQGSIEFSKEDEGKCPLAWLDERTDLKMYRSWFWNVTNRIVQKYNSSNDEGWTQRIAWSNLYKISPTEGGNPMGEEWECQYENCKKLFDLEIKELKPKVILMITDLNWADGFVEDFKITETKEKYVVGIGEYNGSKLIITARPERKPLIPFTEEVFQYLPKQVVSL